MISQRLVLFYAQSGAGKSSLLNARLTTGGAPAPEPLAAQTTPLSTADLPPFESAAKGAAITRRANPKTESPLRERVEVLRYTVQRGDSVFGIAKKFDLEPESVLWGNYDTLNDDPDMLQPRLDLNILPVDGVIYQWESGDSLDAVAAAFKVKNGAQVFMKNAVNELTGESAQDSPPCCQQAGGCSN